MSSSKFDLKALVEKSPSFTTLKELGLETLASLAKEQVALEDKTKATVASQKEAARTPVKCMGKVLAAMKTVYEDSVAAGDIKQGTTFAAYYEEQTGRKLDKMGRSQQCARVFLKLVVSGMLAESDYDNSAVDWHEITSKIIDLVIEAEQPLTGDDMLEVIRILKIRPDTGAKQLRQIRNRLSGKQTVNTDGTGPELDAPNFVAILKRGLDTDFKVGGHGVLLAMSELILRVKNMPKLPDEVAREFYFATLAMGDQWGDHQAKVEEFENTRKPKAPVIVTEKTAPYDAQANWRGLATAFYPDANPQEIEAIAEGIHDFHAANNRPPADAGELNAFMDASANA